MDESKWICERCGIEYDLEEGEGWVTLAEDLKTIGKLTSQEPYEQVCYECADELFAIVEKCDKQCYNCEATMVWNLSIMDCLKFQLKFELIELPQQQPHRKDSLETIKENFNRFLWYRFLMYALTGS
jgi:hypothetical protein